MIERLLDLIGKLPTTQARVLVTLCCFALTTLVYLWGVILVLATGGTVFWSPSYEWLLLLAGMSGLDGLTFAAKRATDIGLAQAKAGNVPTPPPADPPVTT